MNNPAIKKSEYALAIFGLGLLLLAVATSLHYKNLNLFILELFCDVVAVACLYLQPKSQSSGDAIRQITVLVASSILSSFLPSFHHIGWREDVWPLRSWCMEYLRSGYMLSFSFSVPGN